MDFISRYHKYFLVGTIILLQILTLFKLSDMERGYGKLERKIADTQTLLGASTAPDTGKPVIMKKIPAKATAEKIKALLPIKPDNDRDIAYMEKGYKGNENYYPIDTPFVYYVSDSMNDVGTNYSKKLVNIGWQILSLKKSSKPGTDFIESFTADNGTNAFEVEFLESFPSYTKQVQGGSFVKITLKK